MFLIMYTNIGTTIENITPLLPLSPERQAIQSSGMWQCFLKDSNQPTVSAFKKTNKYSLNEWKEKWDRLWSSKIIPLEQLQNTQTGLSLYSLSGTAY